MNCIIDYNWLGIAFASDELPKRTYKKVEMEMEPLRDQVE